MKMFLDTNVVVDALVDRGSSHDAARLLLALGDIGEFEIWVSPTQWTDLFNILSEGGRPARRAEVKAKLASVRKAVRVTMMGETEIDRALSSAWEDFEDAVVYQTARTISPDVFITSSKNDFALSEVPVYTPEELFGWLEKEHGVVYAELLQPMESAERKGSAE